MVMLPLFVIPARRIGARLQEITRESYNLNASMNATMTERFNVAGALLVKLFGRPEVEDESFRGRAARVRDIGVTSAMYGRAFFVSLTLVAALAQALVYGLGGYFAINGSLSAGTVVTLALLLTRLYGPLTALSNARVDVMSALVSFDRVFEVLDLKPMIDDAPDAGRARRPTRAASSSTTCASPTRRAAEVSLASLEDVAVLDTGTVAGGAARGDASGPSRARWSRWSGRPGRARPRSASWCRASTTSPAAAVLVGGHDVRVGHPAVAARPHRRRQPGRAHVPRHDRGQPALRRARTRPTSSCGASSRRRRSANSCARCPTGWTPWSATAATGCPAARRPGWRSPGCCSRPRASSSSTRPPPTWTARARPRCSRRWPPRWPGGPRWSSRTGCRPSSTPTRCWCSTAGASSSRARTPSCWPRGGLYAELYRTQFASQAAGVELGA